MFDLATLNRHFQPRRYLTEAQWDLLMMDGRVYVTEARFPTDADAQAHVPPLTEAEDANARDQMKRLMGMNDEEIDRIHAITAGRYGGHVIVSEGGGLAEAERIVAERGIPGEFVKGGGPGMGRVPLDDEAAEKRARMN